jgi:hypothetical protein
MTTLNVEVESSSETIKINYESIRRHIPQVFGFQYYFCCKPSKILLYTYNLVKCLPVLQDDKNIYIVFLDVLFTVYLSIVYFSLFPTQYTFLFRLQLQRGRVPLAACTI